MRKTQGILIWRIVTITILILIGIGLYFIVKSPKSKKVRAEANEGLWIINPTEVISKESAPATFELESYETIYSKSSGLISGVFVKENAWIKPGSTIAKIADYRIKQNIKSVTLELNRIQKLLNEVGKLSPIQIKGLTEKKSELENKIEELNVALSKCDIKTEFGGFVTHLHIKSGQEISAGAQVATIGRTDPLYINAEYPFILNEKTKVDSIAKIATSATDTSHIARIISTVTDNGKTKIKAQWINPPIYLNLSNKYKLTVNVESLTLPLINMNFLQFENQKVFIYKLNKGEKTKQEVKVITTDSINYQLTTQILEFGDTLVSPLE